MTIRSKVAKTLAAVMTVGVLSVAGAGPAAAITSPNFADCQIDMYEIINGSNDYADFIFVNSRGNTSARCFADAGSKNFYSEGGMEPSGFASGNNAGYLVISTVPDPTPLVDHKIWHFGKHETLDLDGKYVWSITIN